jgi:hypothetical protein
LSSGPPIDSMPTAASSCMMPRSPTTYACKQRARGGATLLHILLRKRHRCACNSCSDKPGGMQTKPSMHDTLFTDNMRLHAAWHKRHCPRRVQNSYHVAQAHCWLLHCTALQLLCILESLVSA